MSMKLPLFTTSVLAAAQSLLAFETWYGDAGAAAYQINTELQGPGKYENAGYWMVKTDNPDGGASKLEWPEGVEIGNEYNNDALDNIIDYCKGVCGQYSLDKGSITYNPYVGLYFDVAGSDDATGAQDIADASEWKGVCISYTVDVPVSLELGLGDEGDAAIGYDQHAVALPKATTAITANIPWTQFKQAGWGKKIISGTEAAKKLAAVYFKIKAASGSNGSFNIMSVGPYMGGCRSTSKNESTSGSSTTLTWDNGETTSLSVYFDKSSQSWGDNAFAEYSLSRLVTFSTEPPTVTEKTFDGIKTEYKLYYPSSAQEAYTNWSNASERIPMDSECGYWSYKEGDKTIIIDEQGNEHKKPSFPVLFKNGNKTLQDVPFACGETPVYSGSEPTKSSDDEFSYKFKGWDRKITAVEGIAVYTAVFEEIPVVTSSSATNTSSSGSKDPSSSADKTAIVAVTKPQFSLSAAGRNIVIAGAKSGSAYTIMDMQGRILNSGRVNAANTSVTMSRSGSYLVQVSNKIQQVNVK